MGKNFYHFILPDHVDLDNKSGEQPGYYVDVFEKYGGIEVGLYPADTPEGEKKKYGVFMNLEEAGDFHSALKKAIDHANSMNVYGSLHKSRIRTPT